jgi:hypothetical protein
LESNQAREETKKKRKKEKKKEKTLFDRPAQNFRNKRAEINY